MYVNNYKAFCSVPVVLPLSDQSARPTNQVKEVSIVQLINDVSVSTGLAPSEVAIAAWNLLEATPNR